MGWITSHSHDGKDDRIGRHVDVYHADDKTGKRDEPHSQDMKISYDENKTPVQDIKPPK